MVKKLGLVPLGDRVVVQREKAEDRTPGGILIPGTAQEKPQKGTVLAVGPGRLLDDGTRAAPDVKVGDKVLFGKWSGNEIKVLSEEVVVVSEADILAKFEE